MNKKPNVLIIVCDQLAWRALPCYGNTYVRTPNIDRIAKGAVRFDAAYTPYPLCAPARAAFWTSRYPHETNIVSNAGHYPSPLIPSNMETLGQLFSEAGYEAIHFGKTHDGGSLAGFEIVPQKGLPVEGTEAWPVFSNTEADRYTTTEAVRYLECSAPTDKPYIMIADLVNPHEICNWIGHNAGAHTDIPIPNGCELPPLPENYEFSDITNRPIGVQYICCSHNRQAQTSQWNEDNFRHYLAAYYHYIELVDAEIGLILDALESRPDYKDTIILFFSDHGEGMASRRRVTKQVDLYEEETRVPFIFKGPGILGDKLISDSPVSLLDVVPTLCDLCGVRQPSIKRGISLAPYLTGIGEPEAREYVASEWVTEWGFTVSPGRMIRTKDYKYTKYTEAGGEEELFDLVNDPLEKINQAKNPAYADAISHHRTLLDKHIVGTNDDFLTLNKWAGKRWRSHKPGYENHIGEAAPNFIKGIEAEDLSE